jgi:hypothetical protein
MRRTLAYRSFVVVLTGLSVSCQLQSNLAQAQTAAT